MKRFAAAFTLLFALSAVMPLCAADTTTTNKKKKSDAAAPATGDTTATGDLCVKPKGSADSVICGLISKGKAKEDILKLTGDADMSKQIADMRTKGVRVKVTGA